MKFTTVAILPTAALAANPLLSLLPRQQAPDLSGLSAAISNTTSAVSNCTTAIQELEFKVEGNTDYDDVTTACGNIGYGFSAIYSELTSSVNLTDLGSLFSLAALEQPLRNMTMEVERLAVVFMSQQEDFIKAEACPIMEKYGPQLEQEVAGFLNNVSSTIGTESGYLLGKAFANADQWAQQIPAMRQQFVQQWCGPSNSSSATNSTGGGSGSQTNGTGPGQTVVPAAAAGIVPQAGMALLAFAGAVLLL